VFLHTVLSRAAQNSRKRPNQFFWGTTVMSLLSRKPYLVAIAVMIAAALLSVVTGVAAA
jgi:hypothetical protein